MHKVYITGVAGMIGSNLACELVKSGYEVIGIDDLSRGKMINLNQVIENDSFSFYKSDISNDITWAENLSSDDTLIHLADIVAGIDFVFKNEWSIFNKNVEINSNIAKAIDCKPPSHFIYIGTACSYPQGLQRSTDKSGLVEEDKLPADPESGYGWGKLVGDIEYSLLKKSKDFIYTNIDLHNVYGSPCDFDPRTAQVIPSLIYKSLHNESLDVWGDGLQGRAFVEVRDVVRAIKLAIENPINETFMIGPNHCTTIKEVVEEVLKNDTKAKSAVYDTTKPTGDIGRFYSGSKSKDLLGWEPEISFADGIKDLVKYIKLNDG